jgi:hypothetical protein
MSTPNRTEINRANSQHSTTEMFDNKGDTYNPKEDGFVFTQKQINRTILARNRDRLYDEALEAAA